MTELKPCPFCGGNAYLVHRKDETYKEWNYYCGCSSCGVETIGDYYKKRAIEAWNTRPNPWHTGTPTEGGLFLVHLKDGTYDIYEFGKEYKAWDIGFSDVARWQKIEEN